MQGKELQFKMGTVQPEGSSVCQSLWLFFPGTQLTHLLVTSADGVANRFCKPRPNPGRNIETKPNNLPVQLRPLTRNVINVFYLSCCICYDEIQEQ